LMSITMEIWREILHNIDDIIEGVVRVMTILLRVIKLNDDL